MHLIMDTLFKNLFLFVISRWNFYKKKIKVNKDLNLITVMVGENPNFCGLASQFVTSTQDGTQLST